MGTLATREVDQSDCVYFDHRLGGVARAIFGNVQTLNMRVPEEILDCVAYIGFRQEADETDQIRLIGTGFFVSIPSVISGVSYVYLATAKHCVVKPLAMGELFIRLNTIDGTCEYLRLDSRNWLFSEDEASDIAVLPLAPDRNRYKYKHLDTGMIGTQEKLNELRIGIGEEAVVAGLFTRRAGGQQNLPIVRFGNISAMPDERLADSDTGLGYHAYLIEARSIGGLSGSPVFAYLGPDRVSPDGNINLTQRVMILIGLIRGHWEHREPGRAISAFSDELEKVNWGIASVTPATELAAILYGEKLMNGRANKDKEMLEKDAPVNDSALEEDYPRFEEALKRVLAADPTEVKREIAKQKEENKKDR